MKKRYLAILALAVSMTTSVFSQSQRNCGTMSHLNEQIAADPGMEQRMQQIETATQAWISDPSHRTGAVITIPVVVHVVYNTAAQNISDAMIQSQMATLNADFRKLNADVSLTPSVFAALAADCQIQFCLAQRDPNGNATTGIVRKSTTTTSFSTNDNVKRTANGGDDAWNSSQYLNLWSANLSGGVLGYAQFPGGAAATDGVVILFSAFGNSGAANAPYNIGRTATHEVGHWLNLRHIWGDANCGSDLVTDTPTSQTSNFGCPTFPHVTCSNGPNGDMFMNYMDYTDDACMYMFTTGQSARITAAMNTYRTGLFTSLGCQAPTGGGGCGTAGALSATSITQTTATLNWSAVAGATSYSVQYRSVGAASWTTASAAATSFAVSALTAATAYEFQVTATCSATIGTTSALGNFTTASIVTGCTDTYEANETRATAKVIAVNTDISAKIGTSTDKDYFKITTVAGATKIKVTLDQLPADYDLKLYSSTGSQLAVSQNGSTTAESIIRNVTTAATYYVYVYGYAGAFNANTCYHLRVNASGTNYRSANGAEVETEENVNMEKMSSMDVVSLFPNPAATSLTINFFTPTQENSSIQVYDMLGKVVATKTINSQEGFNAQDLDISGLNNGVYFLKMTQSDKSLVKKFVVKH